MHTYVTRLVWPDLPWTGDLKRDKVIAKQNPEWDQAPGHDLRFQSKRIQHGSNFGLTPAGISMIAKIPMKAAAAAQRNYFRGFPNIPAWQDKVAGMVREQEPLVNPLGRKIRLFGRPWDGHTIKQGLAFLPQSTVADIINVGVWRIWNELDEPGEDIVELLAQVHDAILFQYPIDRDDLVKRAISLMKVPVPVVDIFGKLRIAEVETEAAIGLNWGKQSKDNPDGLVEVE